MIDWLQRNGGSLLLSVLLSLVIWIVAVREQDPVIEQEYPAALPVVVRGLDDGLVISGNYISDVRVSVRAPQSTWNGLTPGDITVIADLNGLSSGTHDVPLEVELAPTVQAINAQARPADIRLTLEEQRERQVPVQVIVLGQPTVGFGAQEPIVEPDTVTLTGPLSLVDLVSEVKVEVDVSDQRENVQIRSDVQVLDSEGNPVEGVEITTRQVEVTVPIDPLPNYKEVAVIVDHQGTAPAFGYYVSGISVTPLSVTVEGPPDVINEMPGFVRTTQVDLTGLRESFTRTVGLVLPEGVLAVGDATVEVEVAIDAFQGSVSVRRPMEVVGLRRGLEAVVSPESVDMILSGSLTILDTLAQDDIRVVLDLTGLTSGTYQIEPEVVTLPEGITSESLLPATIEVRIQPLTSGS